MALFGCVHFYAFQHSHFSQASGGNSVTFICSDVTELNQSEDSADLVFSNRLLMFLTDEEALALLSKYVS